MDEPESLYGKVENLQDILVRYLTTDSDDDDNYRRARHEMLSDSWLRSRLPKFVRDCRNLSQVSHYIWDDLAISFDADARAYLWEEFRPVLDELEWAEEAPADEMVTTTLSNFDPEHVNLVWRKALDRRASGPEGAITAARTLLETVCKHILDDSGVVYDDHADLPKLYSLTAVQLRFAPEQYPEVMFKQILGGCKSVVEGLGALRNRMGDAHGQGRVRRIKPAPRHAELAVNLAGTSATFLVSTWQARKSEVAIP